MLRSHIYIIFIIFNINSIIIPYRFDCFLSKIHIIFIFSKIIRLSYYFVMKRLRFCLIRYYIHIIKYFMYFRFISNYKFKFKGMLFSIPLRRFYIF
nr:MAG TPA: hypothetical protein [Bacteriophage sp.]